MPEIKVECGDIPILPASETFKPLGFKSELKSSKEVEIGGEWFYIREYEDVINFEDMQGNFLGLIKTRA